jgi:hypothetical protein
VEHILIPIPRLEDVIAIAVAKMVVETPEGAKFP